MVKRLMLWAVFLGFTVVDPINYLEPTLCCCYLPASRGIYTYVSTAVDLECDYIALKVISLYISRYPGKCTTSEKYGGQISCLFTAQNKTII